MRNHASDGVVELLLKALKEFGRLDGVPTTGTLKVALSARADMNRVGQRPREWRMLWRTSPQDLTSSGFAWASATRSSISAATAGDTGRVAWSMLSQTAPCGPLSLLLDTNVVSELRKRPGVVDAGVLNWAGCHHARDLYQRGHGAGDRAGRGTN